MAEIHDDERQALHWMQELAQLLGSGTYPGLLEWKRLTSLPPPITMGDGRWKH